MRGRAVLAGILAAAGLALGPPAARADWDGDAMGDVVAVGADGALLLYRGDGTGRFVPGAGEAIGSGWGAFTALLATEFSGDARADLLARTSDGQLLLYRGNARGGFATGTGEVIGSGWGGFTALVAPGDFDGDGRTDLLARREDGGLLLHRGNGDSGFLGGGVQIGSGWQGFTALLGPGDFSGDGHPDVLARRSDGALLMYRGNGRGGWVTGQAEPIGSGWQSLAFITLVGQGPRPAPAPAPPSAPPPDGSVRLTAGMGCTPPGGRLRVSLRVRKRPGRPAPRVRRVVFFVRNGPRRVDRRKPYVVRLRLRRPAGSKGRVYARVFFRRPGSKKLRRKTVARRFVMCG